MIFISSGQAWNMKNHAQNMRSGTKHVLCHKTVQTTWFGNLLWREIPMAWGTTTDSLTP